MIRILIGGKALRYKSNHIFQLREIGLSLSFVGGFIDAYTFVQRGGVLAAGQTGNLIFLSVSIAQRDILGIFTKLVTILSFMLGVALVQVFRVKVKPHSHYWRSLSLIAELIACIIIALLPKSIPNYWITPPLALVMAMQNTSFTHIIGRGYNNVFSTGNLQKGIIAVTNFLMLHDRKQLTTGTVYFELVLSFGFGAVFSALFQNVFHTYTIIIAALLIIIIGGYYNYLLYQRQKNENVT